LTQTREILKGISCLGKERSSGSQQWQEHHQINHRDANAVDERDD
jgi:hypothetical protein